MNLPNSLTVSRIFLAPVFFVAAFWPTWTGQGPLVAYTFLWVLFLYIEISDIVDGYLARKMGLVSDLGKLLDPFSDVISRLTYFVSFVALNIMPAWILLVLMYRELGITFLRSILFNKGIAMAARKGGKLKAVLYACAGGAGLLVMAKQWFMLTGGLSDSFAIIAMVFFLASVVVSVVSFIDYLIVFFRLLPTAQDNKGSVK